MNDRPLEYRLLDVDDETQVQAAARLAIQTDLDCMGWTDETVDSVRSVLRGPIAWREQHRLVWDGDDVVGYLMAELDRAGDEVFLDAYAIGPRSAEIQRTLLERGIEAARLVAGEGWQVFAAGYEQDRGYAGVLREMEFRPVRRFWRMYMELAGRSAQQPQAPAGVTRRVVDGEDDRRLLHALFNATFAEHFGSHQRPFDEWIASVESTAGVDPSRWWIAELDGVPVALCILDDSRVEFGDGYVRTLGVLREARGRGIARWLLECAAADAVSRGRTGLALAVDGENTTGATALYESVGFGIRQVIDVWSYPLSESATSR